MFLEVWIRVADGWMTVGKAKYQKIQVSCFGLGLVQDPVGFERVLSWKFLQFSKTPSDRLPPSSWSLSWIPGLARFRDKTEDLWSSRKKKCEVVILYKTLIKVCGSFYTQKTELQGVTWQSVTIFFGTSNFETWLSRDTPKFGFWV